MINNLAHVDEFLDYLPKALNFEDIVEKLVKINGEDRAVLKPALKRRGLFAHHIVYLELVNYCIYEYGC